MEFSGDLQRGLVHLRRARASGLQALRKRYPHAQLAYMALRVTHGPAVVGQWMLGQGVRVPAGK